MRDDRKHSRRVLAAGIAATAVFGLVGLALAANQPSPAEQAIKYRQGVYKAILWNLGPMAAMVQNKRPWDAAFFERGAMRISQLAPMLLEGYPDGSASAPGVKTRARPEIWEKKEEFTKLMHAMEEKAAALAQVVNKGDESASRAAFMELGDACKACHDKFRTD